MRWLALVLLAGSTAHADGFDPIDDDGWPKGLTLEDLRELPECTTPLPHTPGAAVTCRPPIDASGLQWGLAIDWTSGAFLGDNRTFGALHALGLEANVAVARAWQLAARYEVGGIGLAVGDTNVTQQLVGMVKLRLFGDEVERNGWVLGAGGGLSTYDGAVWLLGRASIGREVGLYLGETSAVGSTIELAYEHTQSRGDLGSTLVSDAFLASLRFGFETNIAPPADLGQRPPMRWAHATSFEVLASPWLGLGLTLELAPARHFAIETSGSFVFDITSDGKLHAFDHAEWAAMIGPRVSLDLPYVQVQAGGAWIGEPMGGALVPVAQAELGVRGAIGCNHAIDLGAWLRDELDTGDVLAGGLVLRVVSRTTSRERCEPARLALMTPPAPVIAAPSTSTTYTLGVPEVRVPDVHVEAHVDVTPPPLPQPVVIEVDLGAAIPGFSLRLDPRLLPLDRLRGAGYVSIELSGPASEMPHFITELQGTLSRNSVRIDAITNGGETNAVFHAKFTIYPPGTHP